MIGHPRSTGVPVTAGRASETPLTCFVDTKLMSESLSASCPQCVEHGEMQRHLDDAISASLASAEQLQRDLDSVSRALRFGARAPEQSSTETSRLQHESLPTWRSTSSRSKYAFSYDPQLSSRFRTECVPGVWAELIIQREILVLSE